MDPATPRDVRARVLIVENDARIAQHMAWFLEARGFAVRTADSFLGAREHLVARWADLMLSDIDLGSESGREELPRLASEGLLPPTLVVSGYLDASTAEEVKALPAVLGTLSKPFDLSDLERRLAECLPALPAREPGSGGPEPAPPAAPGDDDGWIEVHPGGELR